MTTSTSTWSMNINTNACDAVVIEAAREQTEMGVLVGGMQEPVKSGEKNAEPIVKYSPPA